MFKLLRYFSMASLVACTATSFVLWNFYREKSIAQLVQAGEKQNVALTQIISNNLWHQYGAFINSSISLNNKQLLHQMETLQLYEAIWESIQGTSITNPL